MKITWTNDTDTNQPGIHLHDQKGLQKILEKAKKGEIKNDTQIWMHDI